MVAVTGEYLLWVALGIILLFVVGHILLQQFYTASSAPKIDFEVIKSTIVRKSSGVYFEFVIQFRTNTRVCINFVELRDLSAGYTALIGDKDVNEVSNLPVCVDPYATFTLGGYQGLLQGFSPGSKVMVFLYYDTKPSTAYDSRNPQKVVSFSTVVSG